MYDSAIGRFMQIDPLAEDYNYQSPYNFAENRVIDSRELEGLEAWQSTKNWTDEEIQGYAKAVAQRAEEYRNNGTTSTCEDFALNVLIDYASENGLPVTIENGSGTYDSNSESFDNVSEFKDGVLVTTGASDLQNNSNTTQITEGENSTNNAVAGDIILNRNDENVATHVQVVSSVEGDNVNIQQGNSGVLNRVPGASRILNASNPNSTFYTGTKAQSGTYNRNSGSYSRNGNTTPNAAKNFNLERRKWNFRAFNFRQKSK